MHVTGNSRLVFRNSILVAVFSLTTLLDAHAVNGTILGIVQDQQGGAIGKAEVSARSLDTGAVRKTTAEDNGEYRITSVPAGSYEVTVTAPGFKTEVRTGLAVTVG